jgi:hypothetical protein
MYDAYPLSTAPVAYYLPCAHPPDAWAQRSVRTRPKLFPNPSTVHACLYLSKSLRLGDYL